MTEIKNPKGGLSWEETKQKLLTEGAKNYQYDSDLDGKVDNAEYADNADKLDGKHASAFLEKSRYDVNNNGRVDYAENSWYADDADKLDGKHASDFLDKATYDSDDDGKVDNAEYADNADKLDGKHASAFVLGESSNLREEHGGLSFAAPGASTDNTWGTVSSKSGSVSFATAFTSTPILIIGPKTSHKLIRTVSNVNTTGWTGVVQNYSTTDYSSYTLDWFGWIAIGN